MKILVDFHHSSLLRSHVLMFEERLGNEVFRPIGMQWFTRGFWRVNDSPETARQFLQAEFRPKDETAPLNEWRDQYYVSDPGRRSAHRIIEFDDFVENDFDVLLCSIPQHVPLFLELRDRFQSQAKVIMQVGNEGWPLEYLDVDGVLASIKPRFSPGNVLFYYQEFDLEAFKYEPYVTPDTGRVISSFVNVIREKPQAEQDYLLLQDRLGAGRVKAYGGQCPDGSLAGPYAVGKAMRESAMILHSKPGGDGYGHVIHSAFASGRPVLYRSSHYRGLLAEELFHSDCALDLDVFSHEEVALIINGVQDDVLQTLGENAKMRFDELVDFEQQGQTVDMWLHDICS